MAIHTSIGTSTADSYVSVASADAYLDVKENADAWVNVVNSSTGTLSATSRKEALLKQATREIDRSFRFFDSKYYQGIRGQSTYQALEFPRSSNVDADSEIYIPDEIKYAAYEQALWILQRGGLRTNPETGFLFQLSVIGKECYNYLRGWVNRQVTKVNRWDWQGSDF